MFFDWLMREGWLFPAWWLLLSLAGLAAFPFALRLLAGLPDKGYTFARALGMLLVAFVYWLLASYGFIKNSTGGMIFAWLVVLISGLLLYFRFGERIDWRSYWQENKRLILTAELLFIVLMGTWFVYRAYQNDTFYTEKPMEMAFISAIMRSESFPPNDPWMAGYAISYYYFGYVMTAMLSMLSGVHSGYGFSMMIVTTFSLTGLSLFGVGYNLARSRAFTWAAGLREDAPSHFPALLTGVLTTILVLLSGNFQMPLIQMPHNAQSVPVEYFEFWDVQGYTDVAADGYQQHNSFFTISTPFTEPQAWLDDSWIFGWDSSRILVDYNIDGSLSGVQPIDETPIFSFILMDLHPHVLALPYVTLALGLALNIVLLKRAPQSAEIVLYGLLIGGLIFLNTWDAPIYLVILSGAEALRRLMNHDARLALADWLGIVVFAVKIVGIAVLAYLPFLIGFRSQAGGLIPNLITPTYLEHYFIMFGPLLLLSWAFLAREVWVWRSRMNWWMGFGLAGAIFAFLTILFLIFILIGWLLPETRNIVSDFVGSNGGWEVVLPAILQRRLETISLLMMLFFGIAFIVARLFPSQQFKAKAANEPAINYPPATALALLLLAAAFVVTLVPEFVFLRDNFNVRINTIFKFYYQAWIFFGIAAAYAVYSILLERNENASLIGRSLFGGFLAFVLLAGLSFPVFGVYTRSILELSRNSLPEEQQRPLSLDGRANHLSANYYAAVQCLGNQLVGDDMVVAEASDRNYNSSYGRLGAFYGLPTVINWENHERQWRGESYTEIAGSRRADIDTLYSTAFWDMAVPIIERYGIDYIMFGPTERQQYGAAGETKFMENLSATCDYGDTQVYIVGQDLPTGRD